MTHRRSLDTTEAYVARVRLMQPPWFVRMFGAFWMTGDAYIWLGEGTPSGVWEIVKHVVLLLPGFVMFYPEGAMWCAAIALKVLRRIPFLDRRETPR